METPLVQLPRNIISHNNKKAPAMEHKNPETLLVKSIDLASLPTWTREGIYFATRTKTMKTDRPTNALMTIMIKYPPFKSTKRLNVENESGAT